MVDDSSGDPPLPKHIMVTGGCGYIGSALVPYLLAQPEVERVTVIDNLSRGRLESIGYLGRVHSERFVFRRVDLRRDHDVAAAFDDLGVPDGIVHLAATVDAATSLDEDKRILCEQVNEAATLQLAATARQRGVATFVTHSSTSVYGDGRDAVFDETSPMNPLTPYGRTKLAGERVLDHHGRGMSVVVYRPASVFGWAPGYRYEVAVNLLAIYAHFGSPLTIYRTAEDESRPYLAIEDCVQALSLALRHPGRLGGHVFNVVTFNATLREIVTAIRKVYPDAEHRYTDAALVNQISFTVSGEKLYQCGFQPIGDLVAALLEVREHLDELSASADGWHMSSLLPRLTQLMPDTD